MEHTRKSETFAVLLRFLRRYWRIPAQVAGVLGVLLVITLALPFLPSLNGRLEAASVVPAKGASGAVESLRSKGIGSVFEGQVSEVRVKVGQSVKEGDLLFKMDVSEVKAELDGARSEATAAKANLSEAVQMLREQVAPLHARAKQIRAQLEREQSRSMVTPVSARTITDEELDPDMGMPEDEAADEVVVVQPDPARLEALQSALAAVTAQVAEETRQWTPVVLEAERRLTVANAAVSQLRKKLTLAERRSPMDGVVTSVNFQSGQWVPARAPVARVDNPEGYRIVTLVDKATRETVSKDATVPITVSGTPDRGRLEKVVAGWDKDLYSYWLWFKPSHPEKLRPGQTVSVDLEAATMTAAAN